MFTPKKSFPKKVSFISHKKRQSQRRESIGEVIDLCSDDSASGLELSPSSSAQAGAKRKQPSVSQRRFKPRVSSEFTPQSSHYIDVPDTRSEDETRSTSPLQYVDSPPNSHGDIQGIIKPISPSVDMSLSRWEKNASPSTSPSEELASPTDGSSLRLWPLHPTSLAEEQASDTQEEDLSHTKELPSTLSADSVPQLEDLDSQITVTGGKLPFNLG